MSLPGLSDGIPESAQGRDSGAARTGVNGGRRHHGGCPTQKRRMQSADHTAQQFPIWPTTQCGLFGLEPRLQVVGWWCRRLHRHDVGDCRTAGPTGPPLAGAETTLAPPTFQAESRVASPAGSCLCNFFLPWSMGLRLVWCRDPLWPSVRPHPEEERRRP